MDDVTFQELQLDDFPSRHEVDLLPYDVHDVSVCDERVGELEADGARISLWWFGELYHSLCHPDQTLQDLAVAVVFGTRSRVVYCIPASGKQYKIMVLNIYRSRYSLRHGLSRSGIIYNNESNCYVYFYNRQAK